MTQSDKIMKEELLQQIREEKEEHIKKYIKKFADSDEIEVYLLKEDILELLKSDKTKDKIIKEIEG